MNLAPNYNIILHLYCILLNLSKGSPYVCVFDVSACLVTISFMKALERQNNRPTVRQMLLYYFHRYWR